MFDEFAKVVGGLAGALFSALVFPFSEELNLALAFLIMVGLSVVGACLAKLIAVGVRHLPNLSPIVKPLLAKSKKGYAGRYADIKRFLIAMHRNFNHVVTLLKKWLGQSFHLVTKN